MPPAVQIRRSTNPGTRFVWNCVIAAGVLLSNGIATNALAQANTNQMCGDGTTFTVALPGTSLGIRSTVLFHQVSGSPNAPADSVTLPNGCRIYAIFVSGYGNNGSFTDIVFYKLAKFIAENNGYVHVSWWNNLLGEYMSRPLHPTTVVIRKVLGEDVTLTNAPASNSSFAEALLSFIQPPLMDLPKAIPDEDYQFQADAAAVIRAIKQRNPNAIIVVAGQSMGGAAVARLGMTRDLPIDLLAPIDPVNNRDLPNVILPRHNYNWTRWRVANQFRGFKSWDCIRDGIGLCRDFDSRLLHFRFECRTVEAQFLPEPPIPATASIFCPLIPYEDPGTRLGFGGNIKFLYHRWQTEFFWPIDFPRNDITFTHPRPRSSSILGGNFQARIPTCASGTDPDDPTVACDATDGHGEMIGHRGQFGENRLGLRMQGGWPAWDQSNAEELRRSIMVQMATPSNGSFQYQPLKPNLCTVCDDMITIVQHLLDTAPTGPNDTTAPLVTATPTPSANADGWNNEDVVVDLDATDGSGGSGVQNIVTTLSGAQTGGTTTAGETATETVTAEGTTTVGFLARDQAGNASDPATLELKIDRTAPVVSSDTTPEPNANGWYKTDVTVSFTASDALSGIASAPSNVVVSTEGAEQQILGAAMDRAENQGSASVILNIDKTVPSIHGAPKPAANAKGWHNASVGIEWTCTDALSGIATCGSASSYAGPDSASAIVTGTATDNADNTASGSVALKFDATPPSIDLRAPKNDAVFLLNQKVVASFTCADNLSGVHACESNGDERRGWKPRFAPKGKGDHTRYESSYVKTSAVGSQQFRVDADDVAGNEASAVRAYRVRYVVDGSFRAVDKGHADVVKAGRTIPLHWVLKDARGAIVRDPASFVSLLSMPVACGGWSKGAAAGGPEPIPANAVRFARGVWHYNMNTPKEWSGSCRQIQLTLADGTTHYARFLFR